MFKLKMISVTGDIISSVVIPCEKNTTEFNLKVSISKQEIVGHIPDSGLYEMYYKKARNKLINMYSEYGNNMPEEAVSMWY